MLHIETRVFQVSVPLPSVVKVGGLENPLEAASSSSCKLADETRVDAPEGDFPLLLSGRPTKALSFKSRFDSPENLIC
jgi:hypothetical protein